MLQTPDARHSGPGRRRRAAPVVAGTLAALLVAFLAGPRVRVVDRWAEPDVGPDVEAYLSGAEARVPDVREGAEKGIVWADPASRRATPLAIVYLHGFTADRHEVEPLVSELGRDLGANVFFTRLTGHGRGPEAMADASVEAWLSDAAEAVAVGRRIGGRIVLVGTSTGGTLALWAASRPEAAGDVAALVLVSPNLGPADPAAPLLLWPWGGLIARMVVGPERCFEPLNEMQRRYWTTCHPTEALLPMMGLVDLVRSTDRRVDVPTLVVYSPRDRVVAPADTERFVPRLVPGALEWMVVEEAGDPEGHVLAGEVMSPGTTDAVRSRVEAFLQGVLGQG